ncbi:MAG: SGNH/GDSL hydrolase family protein [Woeseiaceae bacterium]|nr:SGNH/GDSL hydrolase family protein [Woeseiaceae bacterium]NNL64514.1 SGNH/GDSL hydrolase family protein [Woeseiaceae bacterium]
MRNLLFWIAFPFLIPQALYVRRNAPRFAPAGGPSEGSVGSGEQVHLLAIGDSIIAGVGATELSKALVGQTATALADSRNCRVSWRAFGVSGYDSARVLERIVPRLPDVAFDYIIVSVGVNDVTGLSTVRQWRRNLTRVLGTLQAHSPNALVAVAGIPPLHGFPLLPQPLRAAFGMRGRALDEVAKKVVNKGENSLHVPLEFEPDPSKFAPDGYHPSEESYTLFGRHMAEGLLAMEAKNPIA